MGLFDKLKNKVASAAQPGHEAPYAQADALEVDEADELESSDAHEADDWGGWDPNDWQGFWYRLKAIEQAGNQGGDAACDAKCREFGLRDWGEMQRVRDTFSKHFGHVHEFTQAAMNANTQALNETMGAAAAGNQAIFEPVEGIDLGTYAGTQARAAQGGDWNATLASVGCDQAKWERVSAEWNRRMSGQAADMNATMALLTEYGKLFGQAGQGQHGAAAAANAGGALHNGGAVGAEPCTLEQYAQIGGAQAAWAQQGRDVNAMLQQHFAMNALAWSNLSQYWTAQFNTDYRIAVRYGELLDHYTAQYLGQGGGAPADLDADIQI